MISLITFFGSHSARRVFHESSKRRLCCASGHSAVVWMETVDKALEVIPTLEQVPC